MSDLLMDKVIWSNLDHKIRKNRKNWLPMRRVLIALSGGVDSVVLLTVFSRIRRNIDLEVIAAHVHHGPGKQKEWRDQTLEWCQKLGQKLEVPVLCLEPSLHELSSEEELRDFRYNQLEVLRQQNQCDYILTAHHAEDVLETRIIRLLRGTGPQGLNALKEFDINKKLWRPLLYTSKVEILDYVNENQLKYRNDPSNFSFDPLRNWVRNDLLPMLESRQKGMTQCLSRSLQLIVESLDEQLDKENKFNWSFDSNGLQFEIQKYFILSIVDQRRVIANGIFQLGLKNYSLGHIKEIQKKLDNCRKMHKFSIASTQWSVDAMRIYISKIAPSE